MECCDSMEMLMDPKGVRDDSLVFFHFILLETCFEENAIHSSL
jgi:hypothetical protein